MLRFVKTILILILMTHQGFAFSLKDYFQTVENRTWADVQNDPHLVIEWPTVDMGGAWVPVNNLCDTGSSFKTIIAVEVCAEYSVTSKQACVQSEGESCRNVSLNYKPLASENIREQWACTKKQTKSFEISKAYLSLQCSGEIIFPRDENKSLSPYCTGQWLTKWTQYEGNYDVPVLSALHQNSEQGRRVLAYKKYVVRCKK